MDWRVERRQGGDCGRKMWMFWREVWRRESRSGGAGVVVSRRSRMQEDRTSRSRMMLN